MKYCPYCGNYNNNPNGNFCENCGSSLKGNNVNNAYNNIVPEGNTFGWGVLGFLVPMAGLILFLIWNKEKPKSAKSAGLGALIRVVLIIVTIIICIIAFIIRDIDYNSDIPNSIRHEIRERYNEDNWT